MSVRGLLCVHLLGALVLVVRSASYRPNIVFILADDLVSKIKYIMSINQIDRFKVNITVQFLAKIQRAKIILIENLAINSKNIF